MNRIRISEQLSAQNNEFRNISTSFQRVKAFLQENKILKSENEFICETHECMRNGLQMTYLPDASRLDLGRYTCNSCGHFQSMRSESCFSNSRLDLIQLFRIIFVHYVERASIKSIESLTSVERHTVSKIFKILRKGVHLFMKDLYQNSKTGIAIIEETDYHDDPIVRFYRSPAVEIDETLITHLRIGNNKHDTQCWVIGCYDRGTKETILQVIGAERSKEVFHKFIIQNVNTSDSMPTRVYTDSHKSYSGIEKFGYLHFPITHSKGFGIGCRTTNQIESFWSRLKKFGSFNQGFNFTTIEDVKEAVSEASWRIRTNRLNINPSSELIQIIIKYNLQF